MILYEYPLHERVRTYLRLHDLFERLGLMMARPDAQDHHFALLTLFEIMEVISRPELKADVLKELERQRQLYASYRGNPGISEPTLDALLSQLEGHFESLNTQSGRLSQGLADNDFLASVRSRSFIPGGSCSFDLPAYHAWRHLPVQTRQADLSRWVAPLGPLAQAIGLVLKLLRDAGVTQKVMSTQGLLQQHLPQGRHFLLLRMRIDPALGLIPEISCNRMLVVIRLMQQQTDGKPIPHMGEVPFELALCA